MVRNRPEKVVLSHSLFTHDNELALELGGEANDLLRHVQCLVRAEDRLVVQTQTSQEFHVVFKNSFHFRVRVLVEQVDFVLFPHQVLGDENQGLGGRAQTVHGEEVPSLLRG